MTASYCHNDVMNGVTLTGPRVAWREHTPADAEGIFELLSIPEVFRYTSDEEVSSVEQIREFLVRLQAEAEDPEREKFKLALTLDGEFIGTGGLEVSSRHHRRGEIGYMLHPRHWGKGLGTEAAALLVAFGFEEMKLHRVEALAAPENTASCRILEKVGMTFEGVRREALQQRGTWRDMAGYAILSTDPRPGLG